MRTLLILAFVLVGCAEQSNSRGAGVHARPAVVGNLFTPAQILDRPDISLTIEQRQAILAELQSAQSQLADVHTRLDAQHQELAALVAMVRIDEAATGEVARALVQTEAEIKVRHIAMLVRIKNLLTPEQQARL